MEAVNLATVLQTSLTGAVTQFVQYVGVVLPIGLTVFATTFGVKKGMKFFTQVAK